MKALHIEALRFSSVGALNTLVGLAVIFAAKAGLGTGDVPANMLGYGVGLTLSFVLNKRWTFADGGRPVAAAARFAIAFFAAYALNLATVLALRDRVGIDAYLAQAAGVVPYTIAFFLLSRYFVFRARGGRSPASG